MRPADEIPSELEQCEACKGSGKQRLPYKGNCLRCNGDGKLTQAQINHNQFCKKLIDEYTEGG